MTTKEIIKNLDRNEFRDLINSNEGLVIIKFTASWCGPCKKITPVIEELSEKLKENVYFYKIQIDDELNEEICEKCKIKSVPTFILFKERNSLGIVNGADINKLLTLIKNNI